MADSFPDLAVIGGGNMAKAILLGAADGGVIDLDRCIVADPDPEARAAFPHTAESAREAIRRLAAGEAKPGAGHVMLAVKPQVFGQIAGELRAELDAAGDSRVVVSILAGTTAGTIAERLGPNARVVRVMPNTPARVGRGMTAVAKGPDALVAKRLFAAIGAVIEIDEQLLDGFTAVAGSGPAYVFYLAEAMLSGAMAAGLPKDQADLAVRQTILGAAELLSRETALTPAELRAAVTSRRGTTQAATDVLDRSQFMDTMLCAILAARDRGRELAGET